MHRNEIILRRAQPNPGAEPRRFLQSTGGVEPPPHIGRQSRDPTTKLHFNAGGSLKRLVIFRYPSAQPHHRLHSFLAVCLLLTLSLNTIAHNGPPFPIIVDKSVGPCIVSVWTDPDVGESTFFVVINPQPGGAIPTDLKVELGVQPTSGRLAEVLYPAQREDLRDQVQYKASVSLDAQEMWRVRVVLASAQGSGEAAAEVEATPPGYGRWDLLIYLLPFVAVALLWLRAALRRRH